MFPLINGEKGALGQSVGETCQLSLKKGSVTMLDEDVLRCKIIVCLFEDVPGRNLNIREVKGLWCHES